MRKVHVIALMASASGLMAGPAFAQSADDQRAEASAPSSGDIVVSARKRNERLIDVPVAVTALSAADLDKNAANDFAKVAEMAPQVSVTRYGSGSGATFTIRGISSSPGDAGIDQSVSVNLDGLTISRGRIVGNSLFDLQQVEILKGPQALFFGKNSPAGVISLTSAQPTSTLSGYARAGYEFVADQKIFEGAVSGPLGDTLKARVALRYSDQKGWIDVRGSPTANPFTPAFAPVFPTRGRFADRMPAEKSVVGRGIVVWEPTDRFSAKLTGQYGWVKSQGEQSQVESACGAGLTQLSTLGNGLGQGGRVIDPASDCKLDRTVIYNSALPQITAGFPHGRDGVPTGTLKTFVGTLNMSYTLDNFEITAVTGYYWLDGWGTASNSDGTSYVSIAYYNGEKSHALSQELRVASTFDGPFNFVVGGYYEDADRDNSSSTYLGYVGADPATGNLHWFNRLSSNTNKVYSVFGQLRFNLMDNLELAGGARYTKDKKTTVLGHTYVHSALTTYRPQGSFLIGRKTNDNVSPEATLTWHPTDDQTVWAAYKSGWKAGGFSSPGSLRPTFTITDVTFEPEKATGFEVGYKAKILGGRGRVEFNAYTYKYQNLQLTSFDGSTISYFIRNAASARVKGFEGLVEIRPVEELTLSANVGYNSAKYISYKGAPCYATQTVAQGCANPGGQNLSGTSLPRSPQWSGTASANYDFGLSDKLVLSLNTSASYSSSYVVIDSNPFYFNQPSFWRLNAGARLHAADDSWEIALIGRNLTNEYYTVFANDKAFGRQGEVSATTARPREVMVQTTLRF